MAVLVAASPCALAISVPSAVLSGVARAARGGVLIKGGGALENLGSLTSIAFDKTGTLTEGKPKLTDAVPAPGATEDELLSHCPGGRRAKRSPAGVGCSGRSASAWRDRIKPATVADVKSITGRGVQAQVDGQTVHIGKPVLFSELPDSALPAAVREANTQLVANGRTTMVVRKGRAF
jgi:Cd2+/Zn2+-exporting ATPase